ncbi:MAG: LysR family transcriptional regulator, partial [Cytophagaceae bacterium]
MKVELKDLTAFVAVAQSGGFRDAARLTGVSASGLSEAMRRVEAQLGVRLLHRTTRSVTVTEAGRDLLDRLKPVLTELEIALDGVNSFRDKPAGTLKLNVSLAVARLILPKIVPPFLAAYPDVRLDLIVEENLIDVLAAGCDAGVRYDEHLEQDMIALPIGPRVQRFVAAASPAYLDQHGRPDHPLDLLEHACLRGRFPSGLMPLWDFERGEEKLQIDPHGPLIIQIGGGVELLIDAAVAGTGIIYLFEDWLAPYLEAGKLEAILEPWSTSFPGPFLY